MATKHDLWAVSIEGWKSGAVVADFLQEQISGLRDQDGDPLSEEARQFLIDLVFCRIKPRRGRAISKSAIREAYRRELIFERLTESNVTDLTPSERAISTIAKQLNLSEGTVSLIVYPRKSRRS